MRSEADIRKVFDLRDQGLSKYDISQQTGVSRSQIRVWLSLGLAAVLASPMRSGADWRLGVACQGACLPWKDLDEPAYAYLFGQYLGDGCISESPRASPRLRITMCDDYPAIRDECEDAIRRVSAAATLGSTQRQGCTEVYSSWSHWVCLFPQHGPGRKHERSIVLRMWQELIVFDRYPDPFLRGLIHSDGCRLINWTRNPKSGKRYTYPRYLFTNESADIRHLFRDACRQLEIECRKMNRKTISVARRASVAKLDAFIGPKS
jgi:hypothetical protein